VLVDLAIDGEPITTTPEHPFFTQERGWVAAGDLELSDHVRTAAGTFGAVAHITVRRETRAMYNLTVANAHTFFVGEGRWLVHNTCLKAIYDRLASKVVEAKNIRQKVFKNIDPDDRHLTVFYGETNTGKQIVVFSELYDKSGNAMLPAVQEMTKKLSQQGYIVLGGTKVTSKNVQRHAEEILRADLHTKLPSGYTSVEGGVSQSMCPRCVERIQPKYQNGLQTFEHNGVEFFLRDH